MADVIDRVLLWDVDGTLLRAGPVAVRVFDEAVQEVLGQSVAHIRVVMSGKTDPQIISEYLVALGLPTDEEVITAVAEALGRKLAEAAPELAEDTRVMPGVREALAFLATDPQVISSVLSGNIATNARVKVAAVGLDRFLDLEVGAYGSDSADRRDLVDISLGRIAALRGEDVRADQAWVIGDTPLDLACATWAGAHCALVGTGKTPAADMRGLGADVVWEDLSDTATVLGVLTGGAQLDPAFLAKGRFVAERSLPGSLSEGGPLLPEGTLLPDGEGSGGWH
ncbi:MAG: HAD family hydrolase [Acidimicrobiales bacterium]